MTFDLPSLKSIFQPPRKSRLSTETIFDDFFIHPNDQLPYSLLSQRNKEFCPQLDVSETNSHYCLELDLPGINKKDVDVTVDNNILTIKGSKELDKEQKDNNFYIRERFYGDFQRSLSLPAGVKTDAIEAGFKDGVLKIKLPKMSISKTKTIDIKNENNN